jgi:hypothetical protein
MVIATDTLLYLVLPLIVLCSPHGLPGASRINRRPCWWVGLRDTGTERRPLLKCLFPLAFIYLFAQYNVKHYFVVLAFTSSSFWIYPSFLLTLSGGCWRICNHGIYDDNWRAWGSCEEWQQWCEPLGVELQNGELSQAEVHRDLWRLSRQHFVCTNRNT